MGRNTNYEILSPGVLQSEDGHHECLWIYAPALPSPSCMCSGMCMVCGAMWALGVHVLRPDFRMGSRKFRVLTF